MNNRLSVGKIYEKFGNLLILFTLCVIISLSTPMFLRLQNLLNILRQVSMTAIIAVGFTFLLISGGLDLSVGSQIAVMNIIVGLMLKAEVPTVVALLIGLAITTLIGIFNGMIIVHAKVPAMMVTIATMTLLDGLAYILCGGYPIYTIPPVVKLLGQGLVFNTIPIPAVIMLVVIVLGTILLKKTYLGRYFFAVGSNAEAARLSGIAVARIQVTAYAITGFLSGIAGCIMLGRLASAQPAAGSGNEMDVLTGCVLGGVSVSGGRGSVPSAIIGVLIVGVLSNGMSLLGLEEFWQRFIKGAVLLIVIVIDSLRVQRKTMNVK